MDKALQPPEFEIEDQYANIIMIFSVGLAFSGGMPCIIGICFVGILTRYLYLKFLFIRFSRVPKSIDEHLNATVLSYFPWALLVHFLMTIWMYSVSSIFAIEDSIFSTWVQYLLKFSILKLNHQSFSSYPKRWKWWLYRITTQLRRSPWWFVS